MEVIKTLDIREISKKSDTESQFFRQLAELVTAALLDPEDSIRLGHVKTLNKILGNTLERGFALDNQLYINLKIDDFYSVTYLVCDMPKTYIGNTSKPHKFSRK
jgi:hypothetical protein